MKKLELLQKIKNLEGLTKEEKAYLLNLVNTKKKYGLIWEDKPEEVEEELRNKLPVLKELKERAVINDTKTENYPNHLLIEGDNLHALTTLTFTHEGKIDVIYIDPPYNTGNKDFKYNDCFVDKEDSYRHSKWLNFMHKRLKIAKRLLSKKGVIFISIDDNEQAQLRLICDEIFGEENFIDNLIWEKNYSPRNDAKYFSASHDFIVVYKKGDWIRNLMPRSEKQNKAYKYDDRDGRGLWRTDNILVKSFSESGVFPIVNPNTGVEYLPPKGSCWRLSRQTAETYLKENRIYFGKNGKGAPQIKRYLNEVKKGVVPLTILKYEDVGHTQDGKNEIKDLQLSDRAFETPKPLKLIRVILNFDIRKDATILDFYAGSGTSLHAAMQLNSEDGGNRQCILVTNNENDICEAVTYERNKLVILGYTNAKGKKISGLSKNNLRYYQCDFVERQASLKNKKKLTRLATELLCIKENCYYECSSLMDKQASWFRLFSDNAGLYLFVIYDDERIEEGVAALKKLIKEKKLEKKIRVYVFSNGQYPYTEEFEEVLDKVKLCALPDAIYKAYKNILPHRKRKNIPELEEPTAEETEKATEKEEADLFNQPGIIDNQ